MNSIKKNGFTLVELVVSIAIIGILAAVGGNAYYSAILKSRSAEGPIAVRTYYDAEAAFASQGNIYVRDSTHGDVSCRPVPTFMSVCTKGVIGTNRIVDYPPTKKRLYAIYFREENVFTYDPADQTCTFDNYVGHPKYLGFLFGNSISRGNGEAYVEMPTASYFLVRARRDHLISRRNRGVSEVDTLMITAAADLDGDFNDTPLHCRGLLAPSDAYFRQTRISIYARGIFIDREGEIKGTQLIQINELE